MTISKLTKLNRIFMKPKEYHINTLQDIINATNKDNVDDFLKDLKGVLLSAYFLKEMTRVKIKTNGFIWVIDGKHKIDVEIDEKTH